MKNNCELNAKFVEFWFEILKFLKFFIKKAKERADLEVRLLLSVIFLNIYKNRRNEKQRFWIILLLKYYWLMLCKGTSACKSRTSWQYIFIIICFRKNWIFLCVCFFRLPKSKPVLIFIDFYNSFHFISIYILFLKMLKREDDKK